MSVPHASPSPVSSPVSPLVSPSPVSSPVSPLVSPSPSPVSPPVSTGTRRRRSGLVRLVAVLAAVVLIAAACGDDDGSAPDDTATTTAASADGDQAGTGQADATTSSAAPTTTATIPATGEPIGSLAITEVVFGEHVTITNIGAEAVDLSGLWLCNRPSYTELAGQLAPGESVDIPADALGGLAESGGEAALYVGDQFSSAESIIDYVSWNGGGGRAPVAVEAGIWPEGATVVPAGPSIELFGVPGDPESWG